MLKTFKESKKVMEIKMEQANKLANAAENEFLESIKSLVKNASVEDVQAFLNTNDDDIEEIDKMAIVTMFAEENDTSIVAIGIRK